MFDKVRREDMPWLLSAALLALLSLWLIGTLVGQAAFELKHPCTKRGEPRTCQGSTLECAAYDDKSNCLVFVSRSYEYDCTPCIERRL